MKHTQKEGNDKIQYPKIDIPERQKTSQEKEIKTTGAETWSV